MAWKIASAYVDLTMPLTGVQNAMSGLMGFMARSFKGLAALYATSRIVNAAMRYAELAKVQEQSEMRLAATLRATGHAAGFTQKQLQTYAKQLSATSVLGDEAIMNLMAKMATFKQASGPQFKRAIQAAIDIAAVGLGTAESATVQIAKAMEMPIEGMSALKESGVSFNKQEQERIKMLVASGKIIDAQKMILDTIEGQVKGVALAMSKTPSGQLDRLTNQLNDAKAAIGIALIPVMISLKTVVLDLVIALENLVPIIQFINSWIIHPLLAELPRNLAALVIAFEKFIADLDAAFHRYIFGRTFPGAMARAERKEQESKLYDDMLNELGRTLHQAAQRGRLPGGVGNAASQSASNAMGKTPNGFVGFTDLSRRIQEQMLNKDDQMIGLLQEIATNTDSAQNLQLELAE